MRWDSKGRKENSPGDCFQPVAMIDGQAGGDDPKTKSAPTDSRSGISSSIYSEVIRCDDLCSSLPDIGRAKVSISSSMKKAPIKGAFFMEIKE